MTELIFVRHGQSIGNLERRFLGHTDLDLSKLGYAQAQKLAEFLCECPIDAVYSSDLIRAYHTALPVAQKYKLDIQLEEQLREIFAGEWEGQSFSYLDANYHNSYLEFRQNIGVARPDGGESTAEVRERVYACAERIARTNEGKRVLVATHATAIGMFAAAVLGLPPEEARRIALPPNASISIFEWHRGFFTLKQYGENAYLGDLRTMAPPLA